MNDQIKRRKLITEKIDPSWTTWWGCVLDN